MRHPDDEYPGCGSTEDETVLKIDACLPERRLLDEIGTLSCDELATALLALNRQEPAAN